MISGRDINGGEGMNRINGILAWKFRCGSCCVEIKEKASLIESRQEGGGLCPPVWAQLASSCCRWLLLLAFTRLKMLGTHRPRPSVCKLSTYAWQRHNDVQDHNKGNSRFLSLMQSAFVRLSNKANARLKALRHHP